MSVRSSVFVFVLVLTALAAVSVGHSSAGRPPNDKVRMTISRLEEEGEKKPLSGTASKNSPTLHFEPRLAKKASHRSHENRPDAKHLQERSHGGSFGGGGGGGGEEKDVDEHSWIGNISCTTCKYIVGRLKKLVLEQKTVEEIMAVAEGLCKAEKIETPRVCDLVIPQYSVRLLSLCHAFFSSFQHLICFLF